MYSLYVVGNPVAKVVNVYSFKNNTQQIMMNKNSYSLSGLFQNLALTSQYLFFENFTTTMLTNVSGMLRLTLTLIPAQ